MAQTSLNLLSNKRVPVLPTNTHLLLSSLSDESKDFQEIAKVIGNYPSVSARLLGLANSAWSSPISPVTRLDVACSRLGLNVVRSTCIALVVAAPFNPTRCPNFSALNFWSRSLLVAEVSSLLNQISNNKSEMSTRTGGLLHNLGLLLLADQNPKELNLILEQHNRLPESSLSRLMMSTLGYDYAEVGAFICEAWDLPSSLVNAIKYHQEDPDLHNDIGTKIINFSSTMVHAAENQTSWQPSTSMLASLDVSADDAEQLFLQITPLIDKIKKMAQTLFNLS